MPPKWTPAAILLTAIALGQQADIRTSATEVVLDLIVRDKRGRTIRDLTTADIAIQENGKFHAASALRLVTPASVTGTAAGGEPDPSAPKPLAESMRQVRLVTFLFEPLPRESARLARETAQELASKASGPGVFFNVLLARERMRVIHPFTNDTKLLQRAFQAAASTAGYRDADDMAKLAEQNLKSLALNQQDFEQLLRGQLPQGQMSQNNTDPTDVIRAQQARVMLDMQSIADSMQRQYGGRTSLNALRAAVRALSPLPGRKTIVYICRGLTSHPSLSQTFQDLIEAANAAGVSIYGIDATGLEVTERTREAAQMLARAAQASRETVSGDGSGAVTREQAMAFETAEQSAMANPSTLLAELAGATGGLVLSDSNDSRKMAQQIADDISAYWEVTYKPEIETWDGSFHPVSVKVNRKSVKVQARNGYFAIPPGTNRAQVAPFEIPLLAALQSKDPVDGLRFDAVTADLLREADGRTRGDLTVEIPLQFLEAEQDAAQGQFRYRAAVLALFRNAEGEVVDRQSQPVHYQGPLDKLDTARQGLFDWRYAYRLPPGGYTVEIALQDRVGRKIGVRKFTVTVREFPETGLAISDISWVRPDPSPQAAAPPATFEPLRLADADLTPRAARKAALAGAPEGGLPLHFLLHGAAGSAPKIEVEIERDGHPVARMPVDASSALPGDGRVTPYVITLPWRALPPGAYEVRVIAAAAQSSLRIDLTAAPGYIPPPAAAAAAEAVEDAPAISLELSKLPLVSGNLPDAEQRELVAALRRQAAEWVRSLIDFVCLQITDRSVDKNGKGDFRPAGTIRDMLTYSGGKETYDRLSDPNVNYRKEEETPRGVRSFGEFGGLMRAVLSEDAAARIEWKGYAEIDGQRMHVFDFQVTQEKSMYTLTQERPFRTFKPSYKGQILAEVDTMRIRRIKLLTSEIPDKFPFQESAHEIDYTFQRLGGVSYLLPARSVMHTRVGKRTVVRSEMEFSNYRKWSSESKLTFDAADPPKP